ncbi:glycosyltransferase [Carboxylicivirga sp. N1Y90]|uniref:glycosyltransferase n=1 Tax=Carboxylicivirga fragile TaxID=3417571 RepID=UPI003D3565BC|nr:glycosyltransferase [Marinilabiliaceae bacterium N1Y90]
MKLLLINSIGRTKWGGGEKWMIMAAKNLSAKGHDVSIVCTPNSIVEMESKAEGIRVFPIKINSDFSLSGYVKLKRLIVSKGIDAVIGCQNRDARIAGFISKYHAKNKVLVISRQGVQLMHNSIKYKLTFIPFCDGILTNTISIKKEYDSYGWWRDEFVKVIYNGVEALENNSPPYNYAQHLPKDEKNPVIILSTGRITKQKGFKYLISAAQKIVEEQSNVYFFIAGKGKLENELKSQIHKLKLDKHVFLLGFQKDIPSLLKGASLFVLPSLYEGMPNSVMEAMAYGLPVISTNVNGVSELMQDSIHGNIIPSSNTESIVNSIQNMIEKDNFQEIGELGKKHVEKHFTVQKMADNLEAYLISGCDRKQKSNN